MQQLGTINKRHLLRAAIPRPLAGIRLGESNLGKRRKGYQWVDLMIGSHFTKNHAGPNELAVAAAMLEPFRDWMRSGIYSGSGGSAAMR